MCITMTPDMTDGEIKECIQEMTPIVRLKKQGFCCSIGGFDNDPRELWQIPEATSFMMRLVKLGFISTLEVTTSVKELLPKEFLDLQFPGFGALEIWLCAHKIMKSGNNDIQRVHIDQFRNDLIESNMVRDAVCQEPPYRNKNKKKSPLTANRGDDNMPDAPIRHRGFYKPGNN